MKNRRAFYKLSLSTLVAVYVLILVGGISTIGDTYYFEGTGTSPWGGPSLKVSSVPGEPGGTHTITFQASGRSVGPWTNCAEVTSNIFQGIATSCVSGEVVAP